MEMVVTIGRLGIPGPKLLPNSIKQLPCAFVGDEAFPLKCYMMRPYPGRGLTEVRRIFNYVFQGLVELLKMRSG